MAGFAWSESFYVEIAVVLNNEEMREELREIGKVEREREDLKMGNRSHIHGMKSIYLF